MSKRRAPICHPNADSGGGGNEVAAWALPALRDDFEVDPCTLLPVDVPAVNRVFGTWLRGGDFELC